MSNPNDWTYSFAPNEGLDFFRTVRMACSAALLYTTNPEREHELNQAIHIANEVIREVENALDGYLKTVSILVESPYGPPLDCQVKLG